MAYGAVGSDTGGSIRMPASLCGVVGMKPSFGRISRRGVFPLSWSLDHVGPITRGVEDAATMLDACATRPVDDDGVSLRAGVAGMRIGVPWAYFEDSCDKEIISSFRAAAAHMRSLGALVSEVDVGVSQTEASAAFYLISLPEAAAYHLGDLRRNAELYGREFRLLLQGRRAGECDDLYPGATGPARNHKPLGRLLPGHRRSHATHGRVHSRADTRAAPPCCKPTEGAALAPLHIVVQPHGWTSDFSPMWIPGRAAAHRITVRSRAAARSEGSQSSLCI